MIAPLTGFIAGAVHTASGPDHLAAVAPLSSANAAKGWRVGAQWGVGHALAVNFVACFALGTRQALPWDLISSVSERLVGLALIGLGLWGIRRALQHRLHSHDHDHDEPAIQHRHVHLHAEEADKALRKSHSHGHTAFGIGALHGLAGGSHMLAAVAALAFPTLFEAGLYLVAYAVGTIVAMTLFSAVVAKWVQGGQKSAHHRAPMAVGFCSVAAVICGGFWLLG